MSQKRIKRPRLVKIPKAIPISPRAAMENILMGERAAEREKEVSAVEKLIIEDKLDPYRIDDYRYLRAAAEDIGWSIGRLRKAIRNAKVAEAVEDEKRTTTIPTTP